jgi:hypothetical protein
MAFPLFGEMFDGAKNPPGKLYDRPLGQPPLARSAAFEQNASLQGLDNKQAGWFSS